LAASNLVSSMLTMGSPSYWQKTDALDVDDPVRELFDAARPLPPGVEYTATDSALSVGSMVHMATAVLFLAVSAYFTIALLIAPLPESKYPWVAWAAIGVGFAISGIAGLDARDALRLKRTLDDKKARYGSFFTPTAFIQRGVKDTLVLEAKLIHRFEMETRGGRGTEHHSKYKVCVAIMRDDDGRLSIDVPTVSTLEQYQAWFRRARQSR